MIENIGMGSVYRIPDEATGDARMFGTFPNQRILGSACTIAVLKLDDGALECCDELGIYGSFVRGSLAIHISGLNAFGQEVGPGPIKHIGLYGVAWDDPQGNKPYGFGTEKPEAGVIVADELGNYDEHHAMFSACDSFVTLEGVFRHCDQNGLGTFTPAELCAAMDARADRSWKFGKQQIASVRRLLEAGLSDGLPEHPIIGYAQRLVRIGRWSYAWKSLEQSERLRAPQGKP